MNKKLLIGIAIVIIAIIICVGTTIIPKSNAPEVYELTDHFDFNLEPKINYDNKTKKLDFSQNITTNDNKTYEDIVIQVSFYKNNNLIDSKNITADNNENGTFNINFTTDLKEMPNSFNYDVVNATEIIN